MKSSYAFLFAIVAATAVFLVSPDQAFASPKARFLVIAPHTKEECMKALDDVKAMGQKVLDKCDWGCMAGDHTCYVILEAKDEADARKMLPGNWTSAAFHPLNKFTAAQIESFHKK
jgi:hypothetical protein